MSAHNTTQAQCKIYASNQDNQIVFYKKCCGSSEREPVDTLDYLTKLADEVTYIHLVNNQIVIAALWDYPRYLSEIQYTIYSLNEFDIPQKSPWKDIAITRKPSTFNPILDFSTDTLKIPQKQLFLTQKGIEIKTQTTSPIYQTIPYD